MSKLHEIALKEVLGGVGGVRINAVLNALGYYDEMSGDVLGDKEILQILRAGEHVGE